MVLDTERPVVLILSDFDGVWHVCSGARAALCGKLRTFRSLSARLQEIFSQARHRTLVATDALPTSGSAAERGDSSPRQFAQTSDTESEEPTAPKSLGVEANGNTDAGPDCCAVAGLSWRELNKSTLGVSPAGALLLLEQMASGESSFLPRWADAQAAKPPATARPDDGGDPVARYFENYGRRQLREPERRGRADNDNLCGADDSGGSLLPRGQERGLGGSEPGASIAARQVRGLWLLSQVWGSRGVCSGSNGSCWRSSAPEFVQGRSGAVCGRVKGKLSSRARLATGLCARVRARMFSSPSDDLSL